MLGKEYCWTGNGVIILKDADISDNCVIGAGCIVIVVNGFVPEGSIVKRNDFVVIEK